MKLQGVGYRYPSASSPCIRGIDLALEPGQLVLVTGATGSGKSTLLRMMAGLVQRHGAGEASGAVHVSGTAITELSPAQRAAQLGFVSQEPHDQLVSATIGDELAFAAASVGTLLTDAELEALLAMVGLDVALDRPTGWLSGGQLQRLCIAAALSAGAQTLLLDEPLAQLDPRGATEVIDTLSGLRDQGCCVVLVEHRLEAVLPHADRLVVLGEGTIAWDGPADVAQAMPVLRAEGLQIPGLADLQDRVGDLASFSVPPRSIPTPTGPAVARIGGLSMRRGDELALDAVDLEIAAGERLALVGDNGAGKSTLLEALCGWLPAEGVTVHGRVVLVPQDPDLSLLSATVSEEVALAPRELSLQVDTDVLLERLDLTALRDAPPQGLSRGQRQRVAMAAAVSARPALLAFDEPTSGQDRGQVERLVQELDALMGKHSALVFATHDAELAARLATRVVRLHQGRIVADGAPLEVLADLDPLPLLLALCIERGWPAGSAAELARWGGA